MKTKATGMVPVGSLMGMLGKPFKARRDDYQCQRIRRR